MHDAKSTFLVSITTPVEIIVIIILNHAMVLAPKIDFFAMIDVYQKTTGKMDQIIRRILLSNVGQSSSL